MTLQHLSYVFLFHNCKFTTSKVDKNPALKGILDTLFPAVFLWKGALRVYHVIQPTMSPEFEPASEASFLCLNFWTYCTETKFLQNNHGSVVFELLFSSQKTQSHDWLLHEKQFFTCCVHLNHIHPHNRPFCSINAEFLNVGLSTTAHLRPEN